MYITKQQLVISKTYYLKQNHCPKKTKGDISLMSPLYFEIVYITLLLV